MNDLIKIQLHVSLFFFALTIKEYTYANKVHYKDLGAVLAHTWVPTALSFQTVELISFSTIF